MSNKTAHKRSHGPAVVIEVGNDWLKMLHVVPAARGFSVQRMHLEPIESIGDAPAAIAAAHASHKFPKIPVIACLPRQLVTVRMLELPSVDPEEIADMVDLQEGKQTPYSRDEVISDYRVVGPGRSGYTRVMLTIVQRSVVRERYHLLEEAGLDVARMSVSSEGLLSWYRGCASTTDSGPVMLLDVDSYYTDLCVMVGPSLAFTRSVLVGADHLMHGGTDSRDKLVREVRNAIETFQGESDGPPVSQLILTGAGGNVEGLSDALAADLELSVERLDSCGQAHRMPPSPTLQDPPYNAVSVTSLVGAGMAPGDLEFNLVPDAVRLRKDLVTRSRSLSVLALLLMTALISASLVATMKLSFRQGRLHALEDQLAETKPLVADIDGMRQLTGVISERVASENLPLGVLSEIHSVVPEELYFDSIVVDASQRTVQLGGTSTSRSAVRTLTSKLRQKPLFKDARESGPSSKDRSGRFRFQVVCTLEARK